MRSTIAGGNTEDIKADTEALEKAFYKLSEKLYQQGQGQTGPDMGGQDPNMGGQDGTFYDADYTDNQ